MSTQDQPDTPVREVTCLRSLVSGEGGPFLPRVYLEPSLLLSKL